jgi:ATP-dependent RNA helicase RhlE
MSFTSFDLHQDLLRGVHEMGFAVPTPIQKDAIPAAIEGRDVLACAMTGSGKTAAFLLPILQRLVAATRGVTRALVITPTRELAAQIDEHRRDLARFTRITGAAVYGGVGMGPQEAAFRRGVDIIVATPGRLLDHFQYPYARLAGVDVVVLDEADRMLDMGFLPDVRRVLARLPARRQTLLFSATLPPPIVALAREMLKDPVAINVEPPAAPATGITHAAYPVAPESKSALLLHFLAQPGVQSVLAFTRTKHRANRLADFLARNGVTVDRIHGNRSQTQRTQALAAFKRGDIRVLVATDIAARGIDITDLSHVVNFDVPAVPEDYIHRSGRTARAEAVGDAITLVSPEEEGDFRAIERAVGRRIPRVTLPGFDYTARATERLEVPLAERIAAIRARKAQERANARANAERRAQPQTARSAQAGNVPTRGARPAGFGPRGASGRPASGGHARPAFRRRPS